MVLGGGSAGWLTAALLAAGRGGQGLASQSHEITLIESSEASPIGVGEGTWLSMRDTLRRIGLPEIGLIRECKASFKQGAENQFRDVAQIARKMLSALPTHRA